MTILPKNQLFDGKRATKSMSTGTHTEVHSYIFEQNQNSVTILTEILHFSSESEDEKSVPDQLVKKETRPTSKMIKHSKTTATPPESKVKRKGKDTGNAILKLCRIKFTSHPSVVCLCVFFILKQCFNYQI